jgi:hypothetical protein
MNDKKICFIVCVNDDTYFCEMQLYLQQLVVPDGMTVEICPVYGASSMTSGYNQAMQQSDARYKIYLHQDLFVLKRDILPGLLAIFQRDPTVGLIGLAGCIALPASGVWWLGDKSYGIIRSKVVAEETHDACFGMMQEPYAEVEAVDGIFMATQYDIPWRADLFTGWHFYDISQSQEFRRAGFKVVVPCQETPWVMHVCGNAALGEEYRYWDAVFLAEYKR